MLWKRSEGSGAARDCESSRTRRAYSQFRNRSRDLPTRCHTGSGDAALQRESYSPSGRIRILTKQAETLATLGVDGLVLGFLSEDQVDVPVTRQVLSRAPILGRRFTGLLMKRRITHRDWTIEAIAPSGPDPD
jgi:hypothetical protein